MLAYLLLASSSVGIDPDLAARYFQEAQWASSDDGGRLWGQELYGPMVFVDPRTREAVANEEPPAPFEAKGRVFVGKLPDRTGVANYGFSWGGKRWTMVMWPLPQNRAERTTLMLHELFHRIQPALGHPGLSPANAQLETEEGRVWLQVELVALARALAAPDPAERDTCARDALRFRAYRQSLFPGSKAEEDGLDLNEGLAQYTGYMLRGGLEPETRLWLANQIRQLKAKPSYTRSFAYWTGSAYGYLLNVLEASRYGEIRWRKALKPDSSLAGMLGEALTADSDPDPALVRERAAAYDYEAIATSERAVAKARAEREVDIRRRFLQSPVLVLPLDKVNVSFDPNGVMSLGKDGLYYPTATVIESWGKLEVGEGMLMAADRKSVRVAPPASAEAREGNGWKLTLAQGWRIVKDSQTGHFNVVELR